MEEGYQPGVEQKLENFFDDESYVPSLRNHTYRRLHQRPWMLLSLLLHASLLLGWLWSGRSSHADVSSVKAWQYIEMRSLWNPARAADAIEFEINQPGQDYWSNQQYFGEPNDESDLAWNHLIFNQSLRLSDDEAHQNRMQGAARLPGGGHATILGVFHNLHCLRRIRQTLDAEYYYPDMTEEQRRSDTHHNRHCLEAIRTSIICHPDLTIHPLRWGGSAIHPLLAGSNVPRECVNWNKLLEWTVPRRWKTEELLKAD